MRGVRGFAETVNDKVLGALDKLYRFVRDFAAVGEVCEGFLRGLSLRGSFVGGGCGFVSGGCGCNGIVAWCWRDGCAALVRGLRAFADVPADYVQCAVFHGEREAE